MDFLNDFDPMTELAKMTTEEQTIVMQFLMKMQEAFTVNGLDTLKNSDSEACRQIYMMYEQVNEALNG